MILKILAGLGVVLMLFLGYVATRPDHFYYERSGVIQAPPEKIFPYISQLKRGHEWSPYEKGIEMKKTFSGNDGQAGSQLAFESKDSGSGTLEVTEVAPHERVVVNF